MCHCEFDVSGNLPEQRQFRRWRAVGDRLRDAADARADFAGGDGWESPAAERLRRVADRAADRSEGFRSLCPWDLCAACAAEAQLRAAAEMQRAS